MADGIERDRSLALNVALVFAALCVVNGAAVPFLPVWLDWRGLSPAEIAAVSAAPLAFRMVATPLIGSIADRHGTYRTALIALGWTGLAAIVALMAMDSFWPILVVHVVYACAWGAVMPMTDAAAVAGARQGRLDYGTVRVWGSLTFIVAALGGGWIVASQGPPAGLAIMACGAAATILAAYRLPVEATVAARTDPASPRTRILAAFDLVRHPTIVLFLIAAGAVQSSHAMLYIFGTLHWQQLGYSTTWCGLLWAISIVAEIGLFVWSAAFARYLSAVGLMIFGAAAAIVRWVLLGFDPPLALLLPLQALHAATYAAAHLGAMQFLARAAPEGTGGVAQALYATVAGALAMALAVQMAGQAYVAAAGKAYWAMALLAGISLVAALALHRRWDGGVVAVQNRRSQ